MYSIALGYYVSFYSLLLDNRFAMTQFLFPPVFVFIFNLQEWVHYRTCQRANIKDRYFSLSRLRIKTLTYHGITFYWFLIAILSGTFNAQHIIGNTHSSYNTNAYIRRRGWGIKQGTRKEPSSTVAGKMISINFLKCLKS